MSDMLVIYLTPEAPAEACWLPADAMGRSMGSMQTGPLASAAAMAAGRRVVVLVPSEQVLLTSVSLSGLRGQRLRQAVPYALEDRLVADVESLHFAIGKPDAEAHIPCAVVARNTLEAWLTRLREAGIDAELLVPDCLALPLDGARVAATVTDGRTLVRDGLASGFACPAAAVDAIAAARGLADVQPQVVRREALIGMMAPQLAAQPLDLLQGAYARRHRGAGIVARWRLPIALAAAWLLVLVAGWMTEWFTLDARQQVLQEEIDQRFRSVVPDEPMVDPRAQMARRVGTASQVDGELGQMLDALGAGLSAAPSVELTALAYRRGTLEVSITAQRAEQVELLRNQIADRGRFGVSIESASSQGEQVQGRLVLRPGGA